MINELLEFIEDSFTVELDTGRVIRKADNKLLTACKFKTLPLTAREVVWAHRMKELPVGIMLRDPDRRVNRFALDNLEKYDQSAEEVRLFKTAFSLRLAWAYRSKSAPAVVELSEYGVNICIVKLSPFNWRYNIAGLSALESARLHQTKRDLLQTNLVENSYWEALTDSLCLVYEKQRKGLGAWMNLCRHNQTYSHKERHIVHPYSDLVVREPRANKKLSPYAKARIEEEHRNIAKMLEKDQAKHRPVKKGPLTKYAEEVLFPSMQRELFDLEMAKWISDNSIY